MKKIFSGMIAALLLGALFTRCNNNASQKPSTADSTTAAANDVTANWRIGVQMWTFHKFPFVEALNKVDSAGIKYIEAYPGEPMGGDFKDTFGINMSPEKRAELKQLLQSKGITMVAMGVVEPKTIDEWKKTFDLAKDMGLEYITAEPLDEQWDAVDSMAGVYGIRIAIHDHPRPAHYWSPDSVLAAAKGHPHIGACADLGHWARNGLDPVECLKKLDGHIFGVHFKDVDTFNNLKAKDVITGTGVVHFPEVMAELKRQGFHGLFSIEREDETNWYHNLPDVIREKAFFEQQVAALKQ